MIDFNFNPFNDIFLQENDLFKCCPNKHGLNDSATQAIRRIGSLCNVGDIKGCISSLSALTAYLNHDNELVKKVAIKAIVELLEKAIEFLSKENDPANMLKYSEALLDIIDSIKDSSAALSPDIKTKLKEVESILKSLIKAIGKGENPLRGASKDSNIKDEFISSLEQSRKALIGENYSDEFIQSDLTRIRDMSIHGSINRQFQTSQNADGSLNRFIFA